ncbi:MAG: hypothetical protein B9S26_05930 [Opitutia bacterium Tous-C4FEB]|nr:MAG: hypothetical protein B9S35_06025 [Opitutae bacterium Tous-C5TDCM]PAW90206.1 MAG: hypothetical protein B9S26_05930 [Opitutae bacterium Tous-C4FEB]
MKLFLRAALSLLFVAPVAVLIAAGIPPVSPRPMIWVTAADRAAILSKIETQPWAQTAFAAMKARVADSVAAHARDPDAFLRGLPFVAHPTDPSRHPTFALIGGNMASTPDSRRNHSLQRYLHIGTDCAVIFYLTGEESYARCAADILSTATRALALMPRNDATESGGIVYPGDVLYEARAVGAQLPILYDFLHPWLVRGVRVHDVVTRAPVAFDFAVAQAVFRAYARLIVEHGQIDSNHPVLEMPCLAVNALALDDPAERADLIAYLTVKDSPNQDSLKKVMRIFRESGGIWPESFQYSVGVSGRVAFLAALLRRQTPPAVPLDGVAAFPLSLVRLTDFRFPNDDNLRLGDGPRRSGEPWEALEIAYALALREGDTATQQTMGGLLNLGIAQGRYDRANPLGFTGGANSYQGPLQLLWFAPTITGTMTAPVPRTTDALPFAGAVLQRNLSPTGDPAHALMAAVSGASYVHSHATGMALELYGAGHVLGANAGKGTYTTDEHENHRRLFAAGNGVIVNGSSRSTGGWVNLGTDTVTPVVLEPALGAAPVSPNHSFTVTRFTDRSAGDTKAEQQRLVGLVRTSATTGYYVDVFRSRTTQTEQFHDYLYHNLGDRLTLTVAGQPLPLADSPERFRPAAGTSWSRNRSFLFPGWHVFKSARTSPPFAGDVAAEFTAAKLKPSPAAMRVFLPGTEGREYSSALSLETKEAPSPYDKAPTPVLVVRQRGEAWDRPFAAVFEPFVGAGAIRAVTALTSRGSFSGFKIVSHVADRTLTQLVLVSASADGEFSDSDLGLTFRGRYAVVSLDDRDRLTSLYIGEGTSLRFRGHELSTAQAAFADCGPNPSLTAVGPGTLTLPDGRRLDARSR